MNNKIEFAQRLRTTMVNAGLEPRTGVLLNLFNSHYWGRSVTFQAVSRWLKGEAIPAQDKLVVLAGLLNIEPEVLRFGDAFLKLPAPQRKLIREVILTFAKAHGTASDTRTGTSREPEC
jgi:transcriptional regulator with XRE-family HTH domain